VETLELLENKVLWVTGAEKEEGERQVNQVAQDLKDYLEWKEDQVHQDLLDPPDLQETQSLWLQLNFLVVERLCQACQDLQVPEALLDLLVREGLGAEEDQRVEEVLLVLLAVLVVQADRDYLEELAILVSQANLGDQGEPTQKTT